MTDRCTRTGRTRTNLLVYGLLFLLAFQLASRFLTNVSMSGAGDGGRSPGVRHSAGSADWNSPVACVYIHGQSLERNLSDRRVMKACEKWYLEKWHLVLGALLALAAVAARFLKGGAHVARVARKGLWKGKATVLTLIGQIDDVFGLPGSLPSKTSFNARKQEEEDIVDVLAQIHRDEDAGLQDCENHDAQLLQNVRKIQEQITRTLSEEAASWEPPEWFDRMEKLVKHLGNCKLVTSKGLSCAEPCCILSQFQQEFKAEEWRMAVQVVHQAIDKAVNDHAENLERAMAEWHKCLKPLEAEVQKYENTRLRRSIVTTETLAALESNDPGVLLEEKLFDGVLFDISLMRWNASACRKGCQAAREILKAGSSGPKVVYADTKEQMKFWHRSSLMLSELKPAIGNLCPKSVTIVCPGSIYVDCDLCLPGTSFAVQAGCVEIRESCTLNLDGAAAAQPEGKPRKAKNATEKGNHEMNGNPGIGGKDGAPGGSGGHFYCHARVAAGDAKWMVRCAGAKGGKGQDGGDGGNGRDGKKGADASIPEEFPGYPGWPRAYAIFRYGQPATPGGNAGAKGPGGQGGEGGYHGEIDMNPFGASSSAISVQWPSGLRAEKAEKGPPGNPGTCGMPGRGAAHGKHKGVIKRVNKSEDRKEGAGLRMKEHGRVCERGYHRRFNITQVLDNSVKAFALAFLGGFIGRFRPSYISEDDCHEEFDFPQGVPTSSVRGTVPQTTDVQSKHRRNAIHAEGVPKQQLQNDLVAEVQERLKTWPSNEIVSLAQDLISHSTYGCKINLPLKGSRAEALKQAVNTCAEQIEERHCEQVQASLTQQHILVSADYRNDRREAILAEAPVRAPALHVPWCDEWPERCGDFGSPVWDQIMVTSRRHLLQMAVNSFHLSPSMSNLVGVAKALEKDDEEVEQVLANLEHAATVPGFFRANYAQEMLQSGVEDVRDQAADVVFAFLPKSEQEMTRCLSNLEPQTSKADLLNLEIMRHKALEARRRIGVQRGFRDLFSLRRLMTFEDGKTFHDMEEAGNLLLQLAPVLSPEQPLGPWLENYRLFRQSGGIFEPKAVVTCVEHILSLPQLPDETLQVVLVDLMCEVLQLTATQMEQQDPLWARSLKLIAEKPQVLGPVAQCLQLLVSCQKGENIAQIWQTQEDAVATVDEDARRVHREVALASQEMCGCQPEDCCAILTNRHQKALKYLRNGQVPSEVASRCAGEVFKLRMAVARQWPQWGLNDYTGTEDPLEHEWRSARTTLNLVRYGVHVVDPAWRIRVGRPQQRALPLRHETCRGGGGCTFECDCGKGCQCPRFKATEKCRAEFPPLDAFVDAGWSLTAVKIKTADSERNCALQGATFHVLPSETPKYFRFGIDVDTRSVDCRLEAMGQDEEWIEVWKGKMEVAGKQSPWIPFPTVPYGQKTLQFRYVKLPNTHAGAVQKLEVRTSLLQTAGALVNNNIFDFEELCEVTALRIFAIRAHRPLLPSVVEVSSDREHWCTLEVDQRPLHDGWQLLYLNGVLLDPIAAVDQAQAELRAVEAEYDKQLKGYGSKAQAFVDQALQLLEGVQPHYRWSEVLVDLPLCKFNCLPRVAEFLVANQLYRWDAPGSAVSHTVADEAIEAYNTTNRKVLETLFSGGNADMVSLIAAHLEVAEHCTEDADVGIWVQNHAKAKLSVEQAEASRALWRKDHVDPFIKDVILEKWEETLTRKHRLDGFRLPWFLFKETAAVNLANAEQPEDFYSLVLNEFLNENKLRRCLPGMLLKELQAIRQKDSKAAACFCLAIHESLMTVPERDSELYSYVVVETTSSRDEVTEVQFEIGGETIPVKKGGDGWSFSGPKAFCISFSEPQELTALRLVVEENDRAKAKASKTKVRILGSQDANTWMELASRGECGKWLELRPKKTTKLQTELEIQKSFESPKFLVWDPDIGGGSALVQTALAGGKDALKSVVSLLGSCSLPVKAAAAIASQPWNWTVWMGAMSCLEIEQVAKGLSEEERKDLLAALKCHPPAVAAELFLGYQRDAQELGDGKGACPLRVWPQLTGALQRLHSSEMILETFRGEHCRNWPSTLQAMLLEERLQRYANAHPQVGMDDLQNVTIFSRTLQAAFGGFGVVNCLDLMEQNPNTCIDPVKSDAEFLALIWKWRMDVDQVVAELRHHERADWRIALAAMRKGGSRTAEELADLMQIAASCDAEKTTIRNALKLVQDSRKVSINAVPVEKLQEKDIEEWMRTARDNGKDWVLNHMPEVMAVVGQASQLALQKQPYDSQLLPLALLMQGERQALQCLTGEGKQLLLALFSAFRALLFKDGYLIVLTSDADLASREPEELKPFYELVGLRVGHNVSQEVHVRKQTYQDNDVVYAHLSFLLTDYLLTEFFHQAILPEAQHTWKETCVLDEFDKLCTDEAGNTHYLAQDIAGLEHCESILVNAFAAGQCISSEEVLKEVEAELKKSLQNGSIACPSSVKDFAVRRLPRWLHSVLLARQMQLGGNFILRDPKGDEASGPQPITMDLPSGKEQWMVRLSDGLQQFLSLQYDCYVDAESLRSVFISPITFFKKVKEFFGVTGTLGGDHDRDFLRGLFDVGLFDVPPRLPKSVEELDPLVAVYTDQWLEKVSEAAMASLQREQACLVVCQTNQEAMDVYEACKRSYKGTVYVCAEEAHSQVTELLPGDILVATNTCARGVNISVESSTNGRELEGTLHVICAYWPGVREQSQIYGRTSRNGAHGSVQLVLLVPEAAKEDRYLQPFLVLQLLMQGRLEQTAEELWHLESVTLAQVDCAARLFDKFQQSMLEMWNKLKLKDRDDIVWKCVQNVLCADFAFWLDQKDEEIEKISSSNVKAEAEKLKANLEQEVMATWTGTPDDLVQRSCAESVRLAVGYLKDKGKAKEARLLLEKAIEKEETSGFSYAQHLYLGAALLKLDGSKKSWPKARRHFDEAHVLLMKRQSEQAALAQVQSAVNGCAGRPCNGRYLQQTGEKAQLLAPHVSSTGKVCGADVAPDMFLMDVGTDDGMLWRSKQLYNALRKEGAIIEDKVRELAGKEPDLTWLHVSYADRVRQAIKQKRSDQDRFTLEDCQFYAGSSGKVWEYLRNHGYLGEEKSSGFVASEELGSEHKEGLTEVDGGFIVDWGSSKAEEIQAFLRKKDADELDETKSAKCLDSFKSLFKNPLQKVWQDVVSRRKTNRDDEPGGHKLAVMAVRRALQKNQENQENEGAKPLPDTALFKDDLLTECASFASATTEAVAEIWISILSSENLVVVLRNLPDPGRMLHVRLHAEGVLLPPRINPNADLESAVQRAKGDKYDGWKKAGNFLKEAFTGDDSKDPIEKRMEAAKGLFDTAKSDSTIKVSFCHILEEMYQVPRDARGLEAAGLIHILKFEEVKKKSWSWGAFWVAMIGLAQVVLGAVLIYFGCPQLGMALMTEGIGDIAFAVHAGLTGSFSWRAYAMHKVVSLAISLATFGCGKFFKLGGEAAKAVTKSQAAVLVGKMLLQGAFFAAADVGIDKLLEEARENALAESADALRRKTQEMMKPLKKVLCQVILHCPNAKQRIEMIGEAALKSYAFQIAQRATSWAENIGSQLASQAKSNSKPAKFWKAVNVFLTLTSILTSLTALIVVLEKFAGTVKSELEKLVEGKSEKESTEETEQEVAEVQDTLGKLVVDKASAEITSGMCGPAVKYAFRKATEHFAKRACSKVLKIQEKLQLKSKDIFPRAVEPMMAVKPKADKQKPPKKAKVKPAMMPASPNEKTKEQLQRDQAWKQAIKNKKEITRTIVKELNNSRQGKVQGQKIQIELEMSSDLDLLKVPKDNSDGRCSVNFIPRTNTAGTSSRHIDQVCKESPLPDKENLKKESQRGGCQAQESKTKVMAQLHAVNPKMAEECGRMKAHFDRGGPSLPYTMQLVKEQLYEKHYENLESVKFQENSKIANKQLREADKKRKDIAEKQKHSKNGLSDSLKQYDDQYTAAEKRLFLFAKVMQEFHRMNDEIRDRCDRTLNYQYLDSKVLDQFSFRNAQPPSQKAKMPGKAKQEPPLKSTDEFLSVCDKVLEHAKHEMKNGKFANYTVRGDFQQYKSFFSNEKWGHAVTFYILTHQENGKPVQTVHFSDSNRGDVSARAKNWSSLRDVPHAWLSRYDKFWSSIKFQGWATERFAHSKVNHSSPSTLVKDCTKLAKWGLPHDMTQGAKLVTRLNAFPRPCNL